MANDPEFWRFAPLDQRQARQLRTIERATGAVTVARSCRVTNTYYLVRLKPYRGWKKKIRLNLDGLTDEQRHFVVNNETPAERKLYG